MSMYVCIYLNNTVIVFRQFSLSDYYVDNSTFFMKIIFYLNSNSINKYISKHYENKKPSQMAKLIWVSFIRKEFT